MKKLIFLLFLLIIITVIPVCATEITLSENTDYLSLPSDVTVIKGTDKSIVLTLPSTRIILTDDLTIKNITLSGECQIYASGHKLYIDSDVTSTDRLQVYGGNFGKPVNGDTNVTILGGQYSRICGGGYGTNAIVNGDTYVVLGGNANPNDASSKTCRVYGSGYNIGVNGTSHVTLTGNAIANYLYGAGYEGTATVKESYVNVEGGSVMNVYGGSSKVALTDVITHVTITGGTAEALFGGCEAADMTGHTNVHLIGGKITRRVYTGSYNDLSVLGKYETDHYVKGTTTLYMGNTIFDKPTEINSGVFSGSRADSNHTDEYNTIIYVDGTYSTQKGHIGEKKGSIYSYKLKSHHDYIINDTMGGDITSSKTGGVFNVKPDLGNYAKLNGTAIKGNTVTISTATNEITYEKNFGVTLSSVTKQADGVEVKLDTVAVNATDEVSPKVFLGLYNKDGNELSDIKYFDAVSGTKTLKLDLPTEDYIVKAGILNNQLKPLTTGVTK